MVNPGAEEIQGDMLPAKSHGNDKTGLGRNLLQKVGWGSAVFPLDMMIPSAWQESHSHLVVGKFMIFLFPSPFLSPKRN